MAIDSLGQACAPSWTLTHGGTLEIVAVQYFLSRGDAVVVTDHEGPRQAYAAGRMAGHAVLDAVRGAVRTPALGLVTDAPIAITGYSGGAIASGWAAELAPTYAPELNIVGAAFGGTPADYRVLLESMNGKNLASGVLLGATLGVAREYPELLSLFNENGWRLAEAARDFCLPALGAAGALLPVPVQALSDVPHVVDTPIAREVLAANRLGGAAPTAPVFLYQGQQDVWIPRESWSTSTTTGARAVPGCASRSTRASTRRSHCPVRRWPPRGSTPDSRASRSRPGAALSAGERARWAALFALAGQSFASPTASPDHTPFHRITH